jgi:hypothetical protein
MSIPTAQRKLAIFFAGAMPFYDTSTTLRKPTKNARNKENFLFL